MDCNDYIVWIFCMNVAYCIVFALTILYISI